MKIPYSIQDKVSYELFNILQEISYRFEKNGYECYFVGGFIRDLLLERKKNFEDIDISTNARPEEVMKLFPKVIPTGIKHGTVTILYKGLTIECTTYRKESQYSDHRRPDKIEYSKTIYEDLSRRDFTINALAYNIKKQELIDEYNGIEDLKNRLIRSIGNPKDRFLEDGLRPIRACRFMATLEFEIEQNTKNAILDKDVRVAIQSISIERFTEELKKGFKAKKTSLMLKSLYELKILHLFLENDLYEKIPEDFYYYLDCLLNENLKMSYWFWYQKFDLKKISKKLKFSNKLMKIIEIYILYINIYLEYHPFNQFDDKDLQNLKNKNLDVLKKYQKELLIIYKKFLRKLKKELFAEKEEIFKNLSLFIKQNYYNLKEKKIDELELLNLFYDWLRYVINNEPLITTDLAINGDDIKTLGFTGKEIGLKLNEILEYVLEYPEHNSKKILLEKLKP